ncbi:hypothetical protein CEXT_242691, partial [Caerostris extrusa]
MFEEIRLALSRLYFTEGHRHYIWYGGVKNYLLRQQITKGIQFEHVNHRALATKTICVSKISSPSSRMVELLQNEGFELSDSGASSGR